MSRLLAIGSVNSLRRSAPDVLLPKKRLHSSGNRKKRYRGKERQMNFHSFQSPKSSSSAFISFTSSQCSRSPTLPHLTDMHCAMADGRAVLAGRTRPTVPRGPGGAGLPVPRRARRRPPAAPSRRGAPYRGRKGPSRAPYSLSRVVFAACTWQNLYTALQRRHSDSRTV
jgi:hypothetical protein